MSDSVEKFSPLTIALHWVVGLTMIGLLAVGLYMEEFDAYGLYPIHKSLGILIFLVVLVRVVWRIKNGWPVPLGDAPQWQLIVAKLVHWVLIIATVLMPISGMMMSGLGGHGLAVFGFELMATNPDPADPQKVLPINDGLSSLGHSMHGLLGNVLIGAVVLHVAGALKHHLLDKDGTLRRMLGLKI